MLLSELDLTIEEETYGKYHMLLMQSKNGGKV